MLVENTILIENATELDIVAILSKLANLYADTGFTDGIELFKSNNFNNKFLITFRITPDLDRFAYFVNYLYYPEGFENFTRSIKGFYQIKQEDSNSDFKAGDWLLVYVSKTDTDYDNVSVVNADNESFLIDFGGKIKKIPFSEERYSLPSIDKPGYTLVKVIHPEINKPGTATKPWWKFW